MAGEDGLQPEMTYVFVLTVATTVTIDVVDDVIVLASAFNAMKTLPTFHNMNLFLRNAIAAIHFKLIFAGSTSFSSAFIEGWTITPEGVR